MVDHLPRSSLFRAVLSSIPFTLATYGGEAAAQSQRGFYYATSVGVASGASLLGARVVRLAGSVGACPRGGHRSAMAHHRSHAPVYSDGTTPFVSQVNFSKLGYIGITAGLLFRP